MISSSVPSGALLVDKPEGLTSADVVHRIKIALRKNAGVPKSLKIGHGGTLDPFATGVLVILLGEATKLADCYLHSTKSYSGDIRLGELRDTGDLTGETIERGPAPEMPESDWQILADPFVLEPYWQTPPMYSAKKQGGKALHELARQGLDVHRDPILKRIDHFRVYPLGPALLGFEVTCESGTYVRVLAQDLARRAGTVAHLSRLHRTSSSDLRIEDCAPLATILEELEKNTPVGALPAFRPLGSIARHLPRLELIPFEIPRVQSGVPSEISRLIQRADQMNTRSRYLIAGTPSSPVALLERPDPDHPFRLQRIFVHES
jgi:tRNA pseudouridine55 synthase